MNKLLALPLLYLITCTACQEECQPFLASDLCAIDDGVCDGAEDAVSSGIVHGLSLLQRAASLSIRSSEQSINSGTSAILAAASSAQPVVQDDPLNLHQPQLALWGQPAPNQQLPGALNSAGMPAFLQPSPFTAPSGLIDSQRQDAPQWQWQSQGNGPTLEQQAQLPLSFVGQQAPAQFLSASNLVTMPSSMQYPELANAPQLEQSGLQGTLLAENQKQALMQPLSLMQPIMPSIPAHELSSQTPARALPNQLDVQSSQQQQRVIDDMLEEQSAQRKEMLNANATVGKLLKQVGSTVEQHRRLAHKLAHIAATNKLLETELSKAQNARNVQAKALETQLAKASKAELMAREQALALSRQSYKSAAVAVRAKDIAHSVQVANDKVRRTEHILGKLLPKVSSETHLPSGLSASSRGADSPSPVEVISKHRGQAAHAMSGEQ